MTIRLVIAVAFLSLSTPAFAHRSDEYLQATIVSIEQGRLHASMRMIPGVAVSSALIAATDSNRDGLFSKPEQKAYAEAVLHDLSLNLDGPALTPRFQWVSFPAPADMKDEMGEIHIEFEANLPPGGSRRRLILENHHRPAISVYLMNWLAPQDSGSRAETPSI